jgi:endonuclease/exonuclease/phosphatase family metal-dependent hydrolase
VVTIDELLTLVNVALGNPPGSTCEAGDRNQDGEITIDELVSAVSAALYGCVDSGSVTETVGSAGGILRLGGARVMLPAGALSTAHPLTLTRLDAPPPRGYELYSALFRIASSGLTLDRPMELMLNFVGDWRRAKLFCAGQGESIFKHIDAQYLDPWTIGGWVPGLGTCFVAAAADQSSSNCPEGWGPSRCVVVIPVSGSAAQSVVDGKLDPDPDEYRFSQVPPFADTHLQASGGRIYVTIDRDPTASEGTKLRVFLKGLPASNNLGKVAVVLDHDRFSSAHGNYVTAEDRAYRLDLKTGINRAFVGNVNPQDPLSQPAWTDPPPPHTDCTPPPFPVCSSVSPILPWEAKVGAIQTVHPTSFWKPDYFRIDAEFSITLPKIPVPADGSLAGIGFAVEVRSDWMDSPEHVWAAFPEQATGGPGSDYPAERSVFQTLLFADRPRGTPVSILTWNVKRFTGYQHTQEKLFKLITGADPFDDWQVSSKSIGLAIAGYDVVALQEIWETKQAEIIRAAASAVDSTRPYFMTGPVERVIPKEIMPSLKSVMGDRTGGTYILSRYPISAMGQEAYEQCVGEDCLYPKGFLWARVWLGAPDQEYVECVKDVKEKPLDETDCPMPTGALYLDVVSTHLNAGPELCDHADVKEYVKGKAVQFIENLPTAILCPACAVIRTVVDSDFYCGIRDPETVRRNQLEQLAAFLSKNGLDQRQVVITGDFNINGGDGNEKEYLSAMDALRIRSPFLAANAGEFDTLNPFFADFDWDVDRGDLVHEQFPTGWKPGEIGTNIGSNSQLTDINARYDYILVQAANTKLPTHVIAKGPAPVWQRIWMGPIPGYSPDRFSDHMAVAASLEVVPFQYPPKYHPRWAHSYAFQVTYAVGTGDDGWAGSKEELYARIAWSKYGVINWWKTGNCSTSSSVTWPGDGCLAGWAWSDPQVQTNAPKFHSGGVHLWEDDDSSADDDYGVVATPHGRDGMQMFVDWPNGGMTVRDWTGSFTPHGWTDFLLTDYFPISYCGLDGNPDACMETTIGELQP